jgi:hypothetical protein
MTKPPFTPNELLLEQHRIHNQSSTGLIQIYEITLSDWTSSVALHTVYGSLML